MKAKIQKNKTLVKIAIKECFSKQELTTIINELIKIHGKMHSFFIYEVGSGEHIPSAEDRGEKIILP